MLRVINCDTEEEIVVFPTIFPDGTSQVWKLPIDGWKKSMILWNYETESELIWLNQLYDLMMKYTKVVSIKIPYLPYSRQDKLVSNESTFAKKSFLRMLPDHFHIYSLDVHSYDETIISYEPDEIINSIIMREGYHCLVYPDGGALNRYSEMIDYPYTFLNKIRNQLTGEIEKIELTELNIVGDLNGRKILIVDDLCDYGGTFVKTAEVLRTKYPTVEIHLYVSHGLFHGGLKKMKAAGISKFFTSNSLTKYREVRGLKFDDLNIISGDSCFS